MTRKSGLSPSGMRPSSVIRTYREAFSGLPRAVWLLSVAALVNRAGTTVLPFLGLYLRDQLGLSLEEVSAILTGFGLGSIIGVYGSGRWVDRIGAVRMQKLSLVLGGAGSCS